MSEQTVNKQTSSDAKRIQTTGEEIANSITHGIGTALSIAALVILVVVASLKGDAWRIVSLSIFGATLVLLYLSSTLYHAFPQGRTKRVFRALDHTSIFLLIAGTYTPIAIVLMRGVWGWTLFGLVWGLAFFGILYEMFFLGKYKWISVAIYVSMGWLALIAVKPMLTMLPAGLLIWLAIGGVAYTAGVSFYTLKRMPYHHTLWHLFVIAGSVAHFFGMLFFVSALPT